MTWKPLNEAPLRQPVIVWCNILGGWPGDFREWTAIQEFDGWWKLYGGRGSRSRIYPTHWRELDFPKTEF